MTDTEKYYTPDLTEFNYGFEYEYSEDDENWQKKVLDEHELYYVKRQLESGTIRVKHLDHDDIVGCGWKHDANLDGEEIPCLISVRAHSKGYAIDMQDTPNKTAWLAYFFEDGFCIIERIVDCETGVEDMLFRGTILNKSELKFQMKRLGIKT